MPSRFVSCFSLVLALLLGCPTADDDAAGDDDMGDDDVGDDDGGDDDDDVSDDDTWWDDDTWSDDDACDDDGDWEAKIVRCDGEDLLSIDVAFGRLAPGDQYSVVLGHGFDLAGALVLHGPVSGIVYVEDTAIWIDTQSDDNWVGWSIATPGDITGDGHDDLAIGDPGLVIGGGVQVFAGPIVADLNTADAAARLRGDPASTGAGRAIAAGGDLDGDGHLDLLVGAEDGDRAYVVSGPVSGDVELVDATAVFHGQTGADAGCALAGAGDLDGDGQADMLVGADRYDGFANNIGAVYVLTGPLAGDLEGADAEALLLGEADNSKAGSAVSFAGDLDGDGRDEIVVGAPMHDDISINDGAAYVLYGPVSGTVDLGEADAVIRGATLAFRTGEEVSTAGDFDGDGLDDVLISSDTGGSYLFLDAVVGEMDVSAADRSFFCNLGAMSCGWQATGGHDLDGDGHDDILVSSSSGGPAQGPGWWQGAVYLFLGGP